MMPVLRAGSWSSIPTGEVDAALDRIERALDQMPGPV
jgi:hypothetical protein